MKQNLLSLFKIVENTSIDVTILEKAFRLTQAGVLLINRENNILYANDVLQHILSSVRLQHKLSSILNYAFAEGGDGNISLANKSTNTLLHLHFSIVQWHEAEKVAMFVIKQGERNSQNNENKCDLHLIELLIEKLQLPALVFKENIVVSANLKAATLLNIFSKDYFHSNFEYFFEVEDTQENYVANIFTDNIHLQVTTPANNEKRTILVSQLPLDGQLYHLVQILPLENFHPQDDIGNFSAQDIISMASHNLREPVRTIANLTQILIDKLKGNEHAQAMEYAKLANVSVISLDKLLENLKLYVTLNEMTFEKKKVDTENALKIAIADISKLHSADSFEITHQHLPSVEGSEKLLALLFRNLLDNAVKFRKGEKAKIYISAEVKDGNAMFCVKDDGIGFASKYQEKVLKPFERLNKIDEYPGSGLGLSIAQKIVEKHGGNIYLETIEQIGTSVCFSLPL